MTNQPFTIMEDFKYFKTATLSKYLGQVVEYLDLSGKVKTSRLGGSKKRLFLEEASCFPYADTVPIKLPKQ